MMFNNLFTKFSSFPLVVIFLLINTNIVEARVIKSRLTKLPYELNWWEPLFLTEDTGQGTSKGHPISTGTRTPCDILKPKPPFKSLVLIEPHSKTTEWRWGFTRKEHPTFRAYIPYEADLIKKITFSLRDEQDNIIVEDINLSKPNTTGIISFGLPSTEKPLVKGEWYRWYLFVEANCDSSATSKTDETSAWIQRSDDSQIPEAEFVYDCLTDIANLAESPQKQQQWRTFLEEMGLEDFVNEPIVNCCQPIEE